jgi:hypothetical protein
MRRAETKICGHGADNEHADVGKRDCGPHRSLRRVGSVLDLSGP